MKTLFSLVVATALWAVTGSNVTFAGPEPAPIRAQIVTELEADLLAKMFDVSIAPSYAPKLNHAWGGSLEIAHPVNDLVSAGLRFDLLDGGYFAGSVNVTLKKSFTLGKKFVITPNATTGVVSPISHAGDETRSVGAIAGAGLDALLWTNKKDNRQTGSVVELHGFGSLEYWSQYDAVQIYYLGLRGIYRF